MKQYEEAIVVEELLLVIMKQYEEAIIFSSTRTSSESAKQRCNTERSHKAGELKDDVDSPGGRENS
jgi:hypothetical protein